MPAEQEVTRGRSNSTTSDVTLSQSQNGLQLSGWSIDPSWSRDYRLVITGDVFDEMPKESSKSNPIKDRKLVNVFLI